MVKGGSKNRRGSVGSEKAPAFSIEDEYVYDDIEKLAASRDFINIDPLVRKNKQNSVPDKYGDEEEQVVMGLQGVDDSDEEDYEDESEYDDDDDDDDMDDGLDQDLQAGGKLSKLAEVEKKIGSKLKAQQIGEFEDISDEDQADDLETGWGSSKKNYYVEGEDVSDDEEQLAELEEEARRIQKQNLKDLDEADFGLEEEQDDDADQSEDDNQHQTLQQKANKLENGHVVMENVQADLEHIPEEEKLAAVQRDAPELIVLLKDLTTCLEEVRQKVGPLFSEVQQGKLATEEGLSYLEAKHLLLLSYCINIVFYILLKSEGRSVKDHPVIEKMVKLRAYLERIRPLDKKLQHQVDRLLRAAQMASTENGGVDIDVDDPHFLAPNPQNLVSKIPSKSNDQLDTMDMNQVYHPPKMNPLALGDEHDGANKKSKDRFSERMQRRRANQSDTLQILSREIRGAPEETGAGGTDALQIGGSISSNLQLLAQRRKLEAREKIEEDKMTRVPLSKQEAKKLNAAKIAGQSSLAAFDDFADEVNDLIAAAKAEPKLTKKRALNIASENNLSDDEEDFDAPSIPPTQSHRSKFDEARSKLFKSSEQPDANPSSKRAFEEMDEFAEEELKHSKPKKQKKSKQNISQTLPPREDPTTSGARAINRAIKKNQGLQQYRKKGIKTPRLKNRLKHQSALKKRSGQVQTMRSQSTPYEGEKSGIKSNVVRGRKLT